MKMLFNIVPGPSCDIMVFYFTAAVNVMLHKLKLSVLSLLVNVCDLCVFSAQAAHTEQLWGQRQIGEGAQCAATMVQQYEKNIFILI